MAKENVVPSLLEKVIIPFAPVAGVWEAAYLNESLYIASLESKVFSYMVHISINRLIGFKIISSCMPPMSGCYFSARIDQSSVYLHLSRYIYDRCADATDTPQMRRLVKQLCYQSPTL